jgi:hypothetical protein
MLCCTPSTRQQQVPPLSSIRAPQQKPNLEAMDAHPKMIYLPDTMINWPWPRTINPHFEDVKAEVGASFRDFKALSPESQEAFDKCDFGSTYVIYL